MRDDRRQVLLEAAYSLALAGAGLTAAVLVLPGVLSRHPWLAAAASMVWGVAASAGWRFWRLRHEEAVQTSGKSWEEFARALTLIVGCEELLHNAIGRIKSLSNAEGVAVLVADGPDESFSLRASLGCPAADLQRLSFQSNARLVKWLYTNETYLVCGESPEVVGSLPAEERDLLAGLEAKVVLPLVASNRLIGLILVFAREAPNRERIEQVWALVPQLALALENALLGEQQRLRVRRFHRAERLATMGQLAAGAAHEIRNPLASIRSTIQYLERDLENTPDSANMVVDLMAEIDRINAIVEGMLALARPADPVFEEVDLVEVLTQTARLVEPTARKSRVEIETRFPSTAPRRRADPNQLKQVFLNVMMNAVQAMPDGGRMTVSVSRLGRAPGELQWKAEIADTGAGIPEEHQERIFDPFFTTKRDGTGLGLSICHAIVEAHGGQIEVDSAPGRGTRVEIRL